MRSRDLEFQDLLLDRIVARRGEIRDDATGGVGRDHEPVVEQRVLVDDAVDVPRGEAVSGLSKRGGGEERKRCEWEEERSRTRKKKEKKRL